MELERNRGEIDSMGLGLAAISYDSPAILHSFAERKQIHFPLLSDEGSKIIRTVGILNQSAPAGPFSGIPHPGVFVLDGQGKVTAKYFEENFRERYTSGDILVTRFGLVPKGARSELTGKRLDLTLSSSNDIVTAGERIALVIDVRLRPKMHVYAPGVEGYIPIAWNLADSKAWRAYPVSYPASQKLRLDAIDETVPAYTDHFRMTREITIAEAAKGDLTVQGTLRYQACDDTMCYIPETLPLKWQLQVMPFDATRAPADIRHK